MKRIFTKALCLVCAGALALSLAACGGKADSAASSTASSSALGSASDYDYQNFNYSDVWMRRATGRASVLWTM